MLQITVNINNMSRMIIDEIMKNIEKLSNHLNSYKVSHDKLENNRTVVNHYNSSKEFNKIDKDITKISGGNSSLDYQQNILEKPQLDE